MKTYAPTVGYVHPFGELELHRDNTVYVRQRIKDRQTRTLLKVPAPFDKALAEQVALQHGPNAVLRAEAAGRAVPSQVRKALTANLSTGQRFVFALRRGLRRFMR